eukprot:TRINITY_DN12491_c0_g1_i3.p1 TRINITY_DN12491_c0_g1~~TRINITY_DN12491_c0_g1_i3.p1  ORF type:complete len:320 (-),score=55.19 TRINITY_DN12491_c0_g1_i3:69-1028(-)
MPSFTFVSTANAFVLRGGVPVFADVRVDTMNIDESKIEGLITNKTKAIVVVHYAGVGCEMDEILRIARRYNLVVIEDAAHAIQSFYKGRPLGSFGDFAALSFHYTKNIICGEGGAIILNRGGRDEATFNRLRARAHIVWEKGTNRVQFLQQQVDKYAWLDIGSSFQPSELQAAVLWAQLEQCSLITDRRCQLFHRYLELLQPLTHIFPHLRLPTIPPSCSVNGHIFFVILSSPAMTHFVRQFMAQRNVIVYTHFVPLHLSVGGNKFGRVSGSLEVTERQAPALLRLPLWVGLTDQQQNLVLETLAEALHCYDYDMQIAA